MVDEEQPGVNWAFREMMCKHEIAQIKDTSKGRKARRHESLFFAASNPPFGA